MTTVVARPPIPAVSVETLRVVSRLRSAAVDDIVPWEDLEALTSRPRSRMYGMLRTARATLEKEFIHFRVVVGLGVERISDSTVANEVLPKHRKVIGGAAKKLVRATRTIDIDGLKEHEKTTVIFSQTLGELVSHACASKSVARLAPDAGSLAPYTAAEAMRRLLEG